MYAFNINHVITNAPERTYASVPSIQSKYNSLVLDRHFKYQQFAVWNIAVIQ